MNIPAAIAAGRLYDFMGNGTNKNGQLKFSPDLFLIKDATGEDRFTITYYKQSFQRWRYDLK
ncbi:MAG: hypothetical protein LBB61_06680 [Treponema sp.]|nr:hypothetical protein [Treponema sp.]